MLLKSYKFTLYIGDTGRLATSDTYLNYKWNNSSCNILFSASRRGNAILIHLTSDKPGLRKLKQALNEFCEFCFEIFKWCEMIVGVIERKSIMRLAENCGFEFFIPFGEQKIYIRRP